MEKLASTIEEARRLLGDAADVGSAEAVTEVLQDAGGQLGWLQVACCTPARMRLYTETPENLSRVQPMLMRECDLEH